MADASALLKAESEASFALWQPTWKAQVLSSPPLIAPMRQFVYPLQIAGEEDALSRGALQIMVRPRVGGDFLATCALGFSHPSALTGLLACPNADEFCAIAGGYAYVVNAARPETCLHLSLKPVVEARVAEKQELLLFTGFHHLVALGEGGIAWQTKRLSWEGVRLNAIGEDSVSGFGWNMQTDREVAFTVDLKTGEHRGGGF